MPSCSRRRVGRSGDPAVGAVASARTDDRKRTQAELLDVKTSAARHGEINLRYRVRFMLLRVRPPDHQALREVLEVFGADVIYRDAEHVLLETATDPLTGRPTGTWVWRRRFP